MQLTAEGAARERPQARFRHLQAYAPAALAIAGCWAVWPAREPGFDRYHLPKELALLALVAPWAALQRRKLDRIDALALASLGWALLSAACATTPRLSVRALGLQLAVTCAFLSARGLRRLEPVCLGVLLAASGVALVALAEGQGWIAGLSRAGRTPGATTGQRNTVAHLLAIASPVSWWLWTRVERRWCRLAIAASGVLLAAAVISTRSRAGWLALAAAWLVFAWLALASPRLGSRARWALSWAPLGVVLMLLLPVRLPWSSAQPYTDTFARLLDAQHGSGAGRIAQYRASLELVPLHPLLGVGPGNWMVELPRVQALPMSSFRLPTGRLANSDAVSLLVEQGTVALLLAGALLLHVLLRARSSLALPLAAAALVAGCFDAVLQLPSSACVVALVMGASTPERAQGGRAPWLALALAALLLCVPATRALIALELRARGGFEAMERALAWNGADLAARLSLVEAYLLAGRCADAQPHLEALRTLLPHHQELHQLGCAR